MAIVWGAAVSDATNSFRIGYQISQSPTTVANGTASVTVTLSIYLGTKYYANDSGASWSISGGIASSGSTAFNHTSGTAWSASNVTLLATRTKTVTTSFSGPVVTSGSASVSGLVAIAGTATVSWSITTAQRPVGTPATPTGVIASRTSDTQLNVAWTNTNPTSASNPYTNVVVQRQTDGGAWTSIATVGVVTSYADRTTTPNHRYAYRVQAKNGAGYSAVSATAVPVLSTTPNAPGTPTAVKTSSGDIALSWSGPSAIADGIEVWHAANGVWDGSALATIGGQATSYTHAAPSSSVTHSYRLRSKVNSPALTSAYTATSNVVQLLAAPSAPTNLAPSSGQARDAAGAITLTWQHNPNDTTPQTQYQIQWRAVGSPTWTVRTAVTSSTQSATLPASTFGTNGGQIEWQVKTWGSFATSSPFSASAVVTLSTPPETQITAPTATWDRGALTASWTYFDAEGTAEAGWEALLTDAAGNVIESKSGAGAVTSVPFSTRVSDGGSYRVRARTQDGSGLWGAYDEQPFTVTYAVPETPTMVLSWDSSTEAAIIAITNPPTGVGKVDPVSNEVWRQIAGGPWTLVARNVPVNGTIIDPIPAIGLGNSYKVLALSDLPSVAQSDIGYRPSQITNGTFEDGTTTGWTATRGTIAAVASSQVVDGLNVLEYTSTSAAVSGGNYVQSNNFPVTPGLTYKGAASVGIPTTGTLPSARLALEWVNASNVVVGTAALSTDRALTPGDDLRPLYVEGIAPAGATQARLLVYGIGQGMPVGHKLRIDGVTAGEKTPDNLPPTISSPTPTGAVVNAGPGFSLAAKFVGNVKVNITRGRAKVYKQFAGRSKPVEFAGEQRSRTVEVSSLLNVQLAAPLWADLEALSDQVAPACYRDPDGRRIFVGMGEVGGSGFGERSQQFSWTLTEVDYAETVETTA